ncbi:uncharacterized protein METZ01_LOCUS193418, partial [marine metagenome]
MKALLKEEPSKAWHHDAFGMQIVARCFQDPSAVFS